MGRTAAVTLFPPKAKSAGKGPRPLVAFRAPADVLEYLEELKKRGYGATEALVELLRLARDVEQAAAPDLQHIEEGARTEGVSVGTMLGRLARAGFASSRRGKR